MKTVTINVKETSYGFVEVKVPDETTEEELQAKAEQIYYDGNVHWANSDFEVLGIEESPIADN